MKKIKTRIIAAILSAAMAVSMLPLSTYNVYAQEDGEILEEQPREESAEASEELAAEDDKEDEAVESAEAFEELTAEDSGEDELSKSYCKEVDVSGMYQFGGAPSEEASSASYSVEPDGVFYESEEINGLTIEEYIHKEMFARNTNIDVSAYKMPWNDTAINNMIVGIINDYPDLYAYNGSSCESAYDDNGSEILAVVKVAYYDDFDDAAFQKAVSEALATVNDNMSALEKAVTLHDYLAINCEYDYENFKNEYAEDNTEKIKYIQYPSYTAYGVLVNHVAVCQGYALAYKYLLNQLGINCYMVNSDKMNHAWNLVELDGNYYQVDVTWDDPAWDLTGRVRHAYMFLSDETFKTEDALISRDAHSDWSVTVGSEVVDYKAGDTTYDSAFWSDANSPLVLTGDGWDDCYYVYFDNVNKEGVISKKADCWNTENISIHGDKICDIDTWYVWGDSSRYYPWAYSGLFQYNNKLYYNDTQSIYSVDFDGTNVTQLFNADTTEGYIYGTALRRGKVYYSLHTTPDFDEKETVREAAGIDLGYEEPVIEVENITLDKTELVLTMNKTTTAVLKAEVTPSYADNVTVVWSSSNESVATVDSNGTVTAVAAGACEITASAGGKTAVCTVTINAAEPGITVSKTKTQYKTGETINVDDITVTYTDKNAQTRTDNAAQFGGLAVKYTNKDGIEKTVTDYTKDINDIDTSEVGEKELTITYTESDGNILTAAVILTIRDKVLIESIVLDKSELTLEKGETAQLTYTLFPDNATDTNIVWKTTSGYIATVEDGLITAVGGGDCTITAKAKSGDAKAECKVTVTEPEPNFWAEKTNKSYSCGDKIDLSDLIVHYVIDGNDRIVSGYTTNADEIDMYTSGVKTLIITYVDENNKTYTYEIELTVKEGGGGARPGPAPSEGGEGFEVSLKDPGERYVYTGAPICPEIEVRGASGLLVEGVDYTVKYSNNIKASDKARITITGKGNLTGSKTQYFTIEKKRLDNEDVTPSNGLGVVKGKNAVVAEGSKLTPTLIYGGVKLTSKDFEFQDEKYKSYKWKAEDSNALVDIKAKDGGNFSDSCTLTVTVVSKEKQKESKLMVTLGKEAKELVYNGEPQYADGFITVSAKNASSESLIEDEDYLISYPEDVTSAGTKKITITGISDKCMGTVTKSYTIKPKKIEFDAAYDKDNGYTFVSTGTTLYDLKVMDGAAQLVEGKDYKVSYSGNKKAGDAKFTVTGLGNYKGSSYKGSFKINPAVLSNNPDSLSGTTENLQIAVGDKVFKKEGVYKSVPYVSIDGALVKASNYTVTYYLDDPAEAGARIMDKNNKVTSGDTIVWVKITGKAKGNYATADNTCYATAWYTVRGKAEDSYDLVKAKVTFKDKDGKTVKKVPYTGNKIDEDDITVEVTYKIGGETLTLSGEDYDVSFINNINKGKAVVLINGKDGQSRYVGSKTASFSIVANNVNNIANWFLNSLPEAAGN